MDKLIMVDGKEVLMRANALIPKKYRFHFNRDIIQDLKHLQDSYNKSKESHDDLAIKDLEIFENVAWLFMREAGNEVGNSPDEWLASLDGMFSVYEALPQMLELWGLNLQQTAIPKKK